MSMRDQLERIQQQSRERREKIQAAQRADSVRQMTGGETRHPAYQQSVQWTEEGLATPMIESERVGLSFELPAQRLEWNLREANYRILVRTQEGRAATLNLVDEDGQAIIKDRQTLGRAVLDVSGGAMALQSSRPIQSIELHRFTGRLQGKAVLGPFEAQGVVRASVSGEGTWNVSVASEPLVPGGVDIVEGNPVFDKTGDVWRGAPPSEVQDPEPTADTVPWHTARRYPGVDIDLEYYDAVRADWTAENHEEIEISSTQEVPQRTRWWPRLREWRPLGSNRTPSFKTAPALWTNVWGSAQGADKAWDLQTGRPSDATERGVHLIRSRNPDEVEFDGAWGAQAEPTTDGVVAPGTYARADVITAPSRVYVKLVGTGIARKVELQTTRQLGPEGMEVTDSRRVDLSDFFDKPAGETSGSGKFVAAE